MLQRVTATFLVSVYLAGQLAAVPHAHRDGDQPADHAAQPHIHVALFRHDDHSHDHSRADASEGDHSHSSRSGEQSSDEQSPGNEHDSNAVYLPNDPGKTLPGSKSVTVPESALVTMLAISSTARLPLPAPSLAASEFLEECSSGCALFLAVRALRI